MGQITLSLLPSGAGVHTKYAMVMTNDPVLPDFRLSLTFEPFIPRGYRVGSYLFDPSNEVGGELTPEQTYENQVGIYNNSDRPVEIKKVVTNNPKFDVKLDTVEGGKTFNLRIKSLEKLAPGANKLLIKLLTNDPNQDTLEVTVVVNVAGAQTSTAKESTSVTPPSTSKKAPSKKRKK